MLQKQQLQRQKRLGEMSLALAEAAKNISIAAESKVDVMKIKLKVVIDAIEEATESYTSFYDTKTKETVYLPDAFMTGETNEELLELIENEPDRFLRFPTKYDIHEYSIVEAFVDYLPPGKIKSELIGAIRGKGAFRRFKQSIRYHGIEQLWYDYQANAYRELAERWCRDNEIECEE